MLYFALQEMRHPILTRSVNEGMASRPRLRFGLVSRAAACIILRSDRRSRREQLAGRPSVRPKAAGSETRAQRGVCKTRCGKVLLTDSDAVSSSLRGI
jgi:hypothetical protein